MDLLQAIKLRELENKLNELNTTSLVDVLKRQQIQSEIYRIKQQLPSNSTGKLSTDGGV